MNVYAPQIDNIVIFVQILHTKCYLSMYYDLRDDFKKDS